MPHQPYKALYLHIPFCVSRCNYCDFCTRARDFNSVEIDEYVQRLVKDINSASKEENLEDLNTIYIGGGTPSFIGNKRLSSLLYAISTKIKLENILEFSMEANPESLDENLIKDIWALGVNRLSIGVQSFDDDVLKMLGRAHDSQTAVNAINVAQSRFDNVSIDLMCGIPGQSLQSFENSLKQAISLGVKHISVYPLSVEYNTVFYKWTAQGKIDKVDEDVQAQHMELAWKVLTDAGFEHYEVASFAQPGFECKHNLCYWQGAPYLGIGDSATTMTQNEIRRMRVTDGHVEDDLNEKQMIAEDLMLGVRTKYGPSSQTIQKAKKAFQSLDKVIADLQEKGLVDFDGDKLTPSHAGWLCGNDLYLSLMNLGEK